MRVTLVLAWLWAGLVVAAPDIPHPALDDFEGPVRAAIASARSSLDNVLQRASASEKARAYAELGMVYHAHELESPAVAAYRNASELAPDDARWPYLTAVALVEAGQSTIAETEFRRAITINPQYDPAHIRLGRLLLELGNPGQAATSVEPLLNRQPPSAAALAVAGQAALAKGNSEEAASLLRRALAAQPEATRLRQPLALALRELGEVDAARELLSGGGERETTFADPIVSDMLSRSASYARYLSAGRAELAGGNVSRSLAHFRRALELSPDNPAVRVSLAEALSRAGRHQEAAGHLDAVLAAVPDDDGAHYLRGLLYERSGQQSAADSHYRGAAEIRADFVEPRILLANSLMRDGRYPAAVAQLDEVLALQPANATMRFRRAMALSQAECARGVNELHDLTRAFPDAPNLMNAYIRTVALCHGADPTHRERALDFARRQYRQSGGAGVAATLALIEAAHGDYAEAEALQGEVLFDAVRSGDTDYRKFAGEWMEAFRARRLPARAWIPGHPFLAPPTIGAEAQTEEGAAESGP